MSKSNGSRNLYVTFGTSKDGEFVICTEDALVFLSREEVNQMLDVLRVIEERCVVEDNVKDFGSHSSKNESNTWISWSGNSVCPVSDDVLIQIKYRNGDITDPDGFTYASHVRWNHVNDGSDIVAYRIIDRKE